MIDSIDELWQWLETVSNSSNTWQSLNNILNIIWWEYSVHSVLEKNSNLQYKIIFSMLSGWKTTTIKENGAEIDLSRDYWILIRSQQATRPKSSIALRIRWWEHMWKMHYQIYRDLHWGRPCPRYHLTIIIQILVYLYVVYWVHDHH